MDGNPAIPVFVLLFGLAVGSFLNVLIYRLPRRMKIILERSICPHCGGPIPFYLNIPLVSYLILLGKCRRCRAAISPRYPLVELLNAAGYLLFWYLDGFSWYLPLHWYLASSLIVIFFVDLEFQIIPDQVTLSGIIVGLTASIFLNPPGMINSIIGLLVGGGALLGVAYLGEWLFKKEAMGGGDVKMAAMMGSFVGWQKVLLIFLGGAAVGMIVSIAWMMMSSRVRRERIIPFGPFLAAAALGVIIYGDHIIRYYTSHFLTIRAF
jgi:leader peptidase (prepilin peptidase)/N-methyltransferase